MLTHYFLVHLASLFLPTRQQRIAIRLNAQRFEKSLASDSHSSFGALNQQTKPMTNGPIKKKSSITPPYVRNVLPLHHRAIRHQFYPDIALWFFQQFQTQMK